MAVNTTRFPLRGAQPRSATTRRASAQHPQQPSDDEILGLVTAVARPSSDASDDADAFAVAPDATSSSAAQPVGAAANGGQPSAASTGAATQPDAQGPPAQAPAQAAVPTVVPPELAQVLDTHPQLRDAWHAAQQFRAVFATPAAAQDAKNQLDELDGMFFSSQPGDQAALAARIHDLSPGAFHALAQAMQAHSARIAAASAAPQTSAGPDAQSGNSASVGPAVGLPAQTAPNRSNAPAPPAAAPPAAAAPVTPNKPAPAHIPATPAPAPAQSVAQPVAQQTADPRRAAQLAFFHSTNSAAVHQVIGAIEAQVSHLLPSGVSAPTKTRIVGEIYRDLGNALRANQQLGQQLRDAFRSGAGDAAHQQAIVSLVTGRAKQALPSIARRVISEWTHSVVSANHERLARHDTSAKRVDISGAGSSDGVNRKPISPRDVDYKRLSDADILNL
ncbi:MAG: hypothetical protein WA020_15015 [Candidatus Acidiferrales bacterium]